MRTMRFGSTWLSLLGGGLLAAGCVGAAPEGETSAELRAFTAWSTPVRVTSVPFDLISTNRNDQRPTFSKEGLSLYFSTNRVPGRGTVEGTDLWVSQRASVDAPWNDPQPVVALNSLGDDNAPAFSPDGHYVYFGSDRLGGCGGYDLYVAHRQDKDDDFGWEPPVNLGCTINSPQNDDGPTYTKDENGVAGLYFTSTRTPGRDWDIFLAPATDLEGKVNFGPASTVPELSSPKRDTRTALSKDGLEMYVTTNRNPGSVRIYVANRATTADAWSTPVLVPNLHLGAAVDGAPSLSHDGSELYFDSNRVGGDGLRDIYVSTREKAKGGE